MGRYQGTLRLTARERTELAHLAAPACRRKYRKEHITLELKVGDRVRSMEDGVSGTVMRREHDFEFPRYVIGWDDGGQSEIWPNEDSDLLELVEIWHGGLNRVGQNDT